jgi:hypothetical protein
LQRRRPTPRRNRSALTSAESLELFSLDPHTPAADEKDKAQLMYKWPILGSTAISAKDVRTKLIAALKKGIAENNGDAYKCFWPRHAIRVNHGAIVYDIVICFECHSATIYADGQRTGSFLLTTSPQPTFNDALIKAGIKLPSAEH